MLVEWTFRVMPFQQWFQSTYFPRMSPFLNNPCYLELFWCLHTLGEELFMLTNWIYPPFPFPLDPLATVVCNTFPEILLEPLVTVFTALLSANMSKTGTNFLKPFPVMIHTTAAWTPVIWFITKGQQYTLKKRQFSATIFKLCWSNWIAHIEYWNLILTSHPAQNSIQMDYRP